MDKGHSTCCSLIVDEHSENGNLPDKQLIHLSSSASNNCDSCENVDKLDNSHNCVLIGPLKMTIQKNKNTISNNLKKSYDVESLMDLCQPFPAISELDQQCAGPTASTACNATDFLPKRKRNARQRNRGNNKETKFVKQEVIESTAEVNHNQNQLVLPANNSIEIDSKGCEKPACNNKQSDLKFERKTNKLKKKSDITGEGKVDTAVEGRINCAGKTKTDTAGGGNIDIAKGNRINTAGESRINTAGGGRINNGGEGRINAAEREGRIDAAGGGRPDTAGADAVACKLNSERSEVNAMNYSGTKSRTTRSNKRKLKNKNNRPNNNLVLDENISADGLAKPIRIVKDKVKNIEQVNDDQLLEETRDVNSNNNSKVSQRGKSYHDKITTNDTNKNASKANDSKQITSAKQGNKNN